MATTVKDINDLIIAELELKFGQTIPFLPKMFVRVLAKVIAAVYVILYKYADWILLQMFVRTAFYGDTVVNGITVNPLIEYGRQIGVGDPIAATQAQLTIAITVLNQTGSIPTNTQLVGQTNGVIYLTLSEVVLSASTVSVNVIAAIDKPGIIGNLNPGDILSFVNPIPNVSRVVTVSAQVVTGADAETEDNYRERVLDRFQKRPQGGAYADYELWAESVPGVLNAYPYAGDPGEVNIFIESSTEVDGIPTAAQIDAVDDYLQTVRPVGALVVVSPIIRSGFTITITGLTVDNQSVTRTQIENALSGHLLSAEPYIAGLSVPPRLDRISKASIGGVVNDIVSANGGIFSSVSMSGPGGATDLYILGAGEKAKLSGVTFT